MNKIEILERLINYFSMLPSVGRKTAERYAYSIINMEKEDVEGFSESLVDVKNNIHFCKICGNWTDKEICELCSSRKTDTICVVEQPKDVIAFEKVKNFQGTYHVLHGVLSPLKNVGPDELNIKTLLERVMNEDIKEVILATSTSVEGEATALYLAKILKSLDVKVSRIAQGIAMGSALEFVDEVSLSKALEDRKFLN